MRQLWILIAVFALPLIAGWVLHFNPQWLPHGRSNHGVLIEPPRDMESITLQTPEKDAFDWSPLQDQWTLTVLAEGVCDDQCIEKLVKVRQIRRALGAERQRVERLLIMLPNAAGNLELPSLDGLEGTRLAIASAADKPADSGCLCSGTDENRQITLYHRPEGRPDDGARHVAHHRETNPAGSRKITQSITELG